MVAPQRVNAVLILTLGILSVAGFGILTGIPAWIMGNSALDAINSGAVAVDKSQHDMVVLGRFLGMLISGVMIGAAIVLLFAGVVIPVVTRAR